MPDSGKEGTAISSTNKRSISSLKISPKFTPIPKPPQAQAQENANITTPTTNVHPSAGFVSSNPSSAGKSKELTPLEAQAIASQHTIDSAGVISSPDALHTMSAVRRTTSATGSLTKSIMNVSGTSGAVVNNAPGEGKKRSPTITFSDAKTNKYAQIQSQMATEQGQSQGQLQAKIGGSGTGVAPAAPDGILKPGTGATTMPQPPIMPQVGESSSTVGSSNISRHGSILNKPQSTNDRNINVKPTFTDQPSHNPKEPVSAAGKQLSEINTKVLNDGSPLPPSIASPFSAMTPADKVTIDQALPINLSELKLAKEHAYFYVDDLLHTPASSRIPTSSNPERPWSNGSGGSTGTGSTIKPVEGGVAVDANVSLKNNALKTVLNEDNANLSSPLSASISSASVANSNASIMNMLKRESGKNVDPRLPLDDGKLHILFGATGSLSVFKLKQMIKKLEEIYGRDKISIMVILTENATKFFTQRYLRKISLRKNLQLQQQGEQTTKKAGAAESTTETEHPGVAVNTSAPSVTSPTTVAGANETTAVHNETGGQPPPPPPAQPQQPASSATAAAGVVNTTSNIPQVQQLQGFTQIELPPHIQIWRDQDEWDTWKQRSDPVLHIELRRWADILVVAPLTANTLSKISLGLCDNLLTNVIRAWNPNVPILLAPAMVSSTYNSLMTRKQLKIISEEMPWMTVFKPSEKVMSINGDIGLGGMMDANEIVDKIVMKLGGYPKDEDEDENEGEDDENDDEEEEEEEEGEDGSENKEKNDNEDEDEDDDDDDDDDEDEDDDDDDDDDEEQSNNSVIKTKGDVPQPGTQGAE